MRLVRLPPYKLSTQRNDAETAPTARAKNTKDGHRHWLPRVLVVEELWPEQVLDLNCDHATAHVPAPELLAELENARPGQPVRRVF